MRTSLKSLFLLPIFSSAALSACGNASDAPTPKTAEKPAMIPHVTEETQTVSTVSRGEKLYKRCVTCHTLEAGGKHKVGPNLHGIYGATAGTKEGFAYSKAMQASGIVWADETLSGYIENPAKYMPKNKMSFVGLRKPEDRDALLNYLKDATQ